MECRTDNTDWPLVRVRDSVNWWMNFTDTDENWLGSLYIDPDIIPGYKILPKKRWSRLVKALPPVIAAQCILESNYPQ